MKEKDYRDNEDHFLKIIAEAMGKKFDEPNILHSSGSPKVAGLAAGRPIRLFNPEGNAEQRWELLIWFAGRSHRDRNSTATKRALFSITRGLIIKNETMGLILATLELILEYGGNNERS